MYSISSYLNFEYKMELSWYNRQKKIFEGTDKKIQGENNILQIGKIGLPVEYTYVFAIFLLF